MSLITKLTTAAACTALLLGGFTAAPAQAEGTSSGSGSLTLDVRYAGKQREVVVSGVSTVSDAIKALNLAVDADDRVTPSLDTPLTDRMSVVIDVVSTSTTVKKNVTVKKRTITKKTRSLFKGDKKVVTKGRDGRATRTYLTTTVNGESSTVVVAEKVTRKVINRVIKVGTNGKRTINLARLSKWNKIAKCESGGRWHINTGNGYYGGLQFNRATWRSVKGQQFAAYPHKATKAEQITVANRLYAKRGFKPWSCRHVL